MDELEAAEERAETAEKALQRAKRSGSSGVGSSSRSSLGRQVSDSLPWLRINHSFSRSRRIKTNRYSAIF